MKWYEACIACDQPRAPDDGFCAKHRAEHEASPWVKAWREYQRQVTAAGPQGYKKVYWVAPKRS